ncbi:hypothetical protein LDL08_06395 [Nonomuraea glycinis]|uniref:Secreted protein n=1 Tax=Nonomuraea glycinis TaxID=2047744 RepID=A0A918E3Q3_9ACTN|nr:hypothetical protein [Nonomuraea glycinis]MCA2175812.1 hypothetical protein [Nonomuraea glycinis]GGP05424.1 hypothetical protein GCM10012278_24900 [Nonomuraea glycinis]
MKTRILSAALAIATLSGLLVASPAQARDGVSSGRTTRPSGGNGYAQVTVDFVSRTKVVFRNLKVRDLCPHDNLPVKARAVWKYTTGSWHTGAWKKDTNGCRDKGTNFGNYVRSGSRAISAVALELCVYNKKSDFHCVNTTTRYNQYVHRGR